MPPGFNRLHRGQLLCCQHLEQHSVAAGTVQDAGESKFFVFCRESLLYVSPTDFATSSKCVLIRLVAPAMKMASGLAAGQQLQWMHSTHLDFSQHYGPFWVLDYITAPNIYGHRNGPIILGTTHLFKPDHSCTGKVRQRPHMSEFNSKRSTCFSIVSCSYYYHYCLSYSYLALRFLSLLFLPLLLLSRAPNPDLGVDGFEVLLFFPSCPVACHQWYWRSVGNMRIYYIGTRPIV